ncbi:MAG: tetratricopeptide repeat protein [Vulcanimicrobiota bacterium]
MGFLKFLDSIFCFTERAKIYKFKQNNQPDLISPFLGSSQEEIQKLAIDALKNMVYEKKLSPSKEEEVACQLEKYIPIRDLIRIDSLHDPMEIRKIAVNQYLERENPEMYFYSINRAIKMKPDELSFLNNLAEGFLKTGEGKKAEQQWCWVLKQDKNNVEARFEYSNYLLMLARDLLKKGNIEKARHIYEKVVHIDENNLDSNYELGLLLSDLEEYENCLACLSRTLKINRAGLGFADIYEFRSIVYKKIAWVYEQLKNTEKAQIYIKKANKIYSTDADI